MFSDTIKPAPTRHGHTLPGGPTVRQLPSQDTESLNSVAFPFSEVGDTPVINASALRVVAVAPPGGLNAVTGTANNDTLTDSNGELAGGAALAP